MLAPTRKTKRYYKETQRAYSLPADIAPGTTAISLSAAVLVHSAGSVDLGELAVSRDLKSNENAL